MKMKAAVLYEINKPLIIEDIEVPDPELGQVLVKVISSGICHTQLDNVKGKYGTDPYLPHLLGHEGAGVVEKIGPGVTRVAPGDHVILSWIQGLGFNAKTPLYMMGTQKINAGPVTTFNDYTIASENRVTKIKDDVPFDVASIIGCAVSTGLGAVLNESKVQPGTSVAVFGIGGIGLNIIQGSSLVNALKIIAVDVHEEKLDVAKKFGATHVINAKKEDPVKKIKELTDGKGVDYAFESAGLKETMEQAYQAACNTGLINLVGNPAHNEKICIDALQTHYGKQLIGSHGGHTRPDVDFARYISLYQAGKLKIDELITHRYKLDDVNDAIDEMLAGHIGRAIIELNHLVKKGK
jgi:S-(hydroxymethyl)glutathione dehydrogenase/alcohol dehydrogenase